MTDKAILAAEAASDRSFFGHPRGLATLFMTEMWERFSYYGMRALLIFYLTQHFLFSDSRSFLIYGAYTSLVYLTPVIGGLLADRYLGSRKAVTFGAILLVLGQFGMAIQGPIAEHMVAADGSVSIVRDAFFQNIFYFSLALIITGVGFLKANISTIVGALYPKGDSRRDSGFTIFYMGINLGAMLGALIAGWVGITVGWWAGFGLAGFGMVGGLIQFLKGQKYLYGHADPPSVKVLKEKIFAGISREYIIYIGGILAVVAIWQLIQHQELVGTMYDGFGLLVLAAIMAFSFLKCEREDRNKMLVATFLILTSVLFWALFEQAGSSLNLLAQRNVDREVLGIEIPAPVFQSLNSLFIITLAPLFSILWIYLSKIKREPSTPVKFGLGIIQLGFGYLVLVFGMGLAGDGQTALIWLVLIYFFHTSGELCLSPVGLSMITKLSVTRVVGMMMGAWFLASGYANFLAGRIAQLTSGGGEGAEGAASSVAIYIEVFQNVGLLAVGVGMAILIISPILRKYMHGVH
ncbi:MAG: MFS transporter [Alphaproteobacteria bacterium]|nr:MAG: MFS transporter [Alphaproteobacteria bacterium]